MINQQSSFPAKTMLGVPSFPTTDSPQRLSSSSGNNDDRRGSRSKVSLKPGRSLMHWIKLANGAQDIQGFNGRVFPITLSELAKHNKVNDCWMAIRGQVYNVTSYMEYHPGGVDELMRGAGKDATNLFNEVHKWVNFNSMLQKCYIGPLKFDFGETKPTQKKPEMQFKKTNDGFMIPAMIPTKSPVEVMPRYDWYEKEETIVLSLYTKTKLIDSCDVLLDCMDCKTLNVKIFLGPKYYQLLLDLEHEVEKVVVHSTNQTKVVIHLVKKDCTLKWKNVGSPLPGHNVLQMDNNRDIKFRDCIVEEITRVTHDTKLYKIALPANVHYETPIGHHVIIKDDVEGMEMRRNYTVVLPSIDAIVGDGGSTRGRYLHLLIKCYPNGVLTPHIDNLNPGDSISTSDCIGTFQRTRLKEASEIFLIAAGTGFTPMVRLINYYLFEDAPEDCHVKLLFLNKTEEDIIWKDQLDSLAKKFPDRFSVTYTLSRSRDTWKGPIGRINELKLKNFISENPFSGTSCSSSSNAPTSSTPSIRSEDSVTKGLDKLYAICGPDQFTLDIKQMLLKCGIREESIHCFLA